MDRILVIRGGAIGDFILTLPALKVLREEFPHAHLEILGYKHIVAVAEKRFYADATRSIESALLAPFFGRKTDLPAEMADYFASFDLVLSYLFDPDEIFSDNLKRSGVKRLVTGSPKIDNCENAARQLARPLQHLGLQLSDPAPKIFPSQSDVTAAAEFLGEAQSQIVALHPGSGSERKNWPLSNWLHLGDTLLAENETTRLIVVTGEAEQEQFAGLQKHWRDAPVHFAHILPLPVLAALLARARLFVGHDSGISHLAAATGASCLLLYGPTDPAIWAPLNQAVTILRAPEGNLSALTFDTVRAAVSRM